VSSICMTGSRRCLTSESRPCRSHSLQPGHRSAQALTDAARQVIVELTKGLEPSVVSDPRILRTVAYIKRHLDRPLTLEEISAGAFLSPSRFRHLFVEETGMALGPYILWRRSVRVWQLLIDGESLSSFAPPILKRSSNGFSTQAWGASRTRRHAGSTLPRLAARYARLFRLDCERRASFSLGPRRQGRCYVTCLSAVRVNTTTPKAPTAPAM